MAGPMNEPRPMSSYNLRTARLKQIIDDCMEEAEVASSDGMPHAALSFRDAAKFLQITASVLAMCKGKIQGTDNLMSNEPGSVGMHEIGRSHAYSEILELFGITDD